MSSELITITEYDEFREKMEEVKEACNFLPDMTTDDGYEKSKRVALDVGKVLTGLEKARKAKKAESIATGKAIDSEAKSIVATLEKFQLPHKDAYKELDQLKKQREQDRKDSLEERVNEFRNMPEMMSDMDSGAIKGAMEEIAANECLDFYEFTEQALKARNTAKSELSKMFADKLKQEKDAAELAELRKKQAEQEQKDREESIAKAASEKAEAAAAQAKAAEQAAIEQAAEAVKQREAAELRAKLDAELAEGQRILDAQETKNQIALASAIAKKQAETAAINAHNRAILEQEEKEAVEAAEVERREADKRHVGAIRKAAKESLMAVGLDEAMAKKVVLAIHANDIANVSIKY